MSQINKIKGLLAISPVIVLLVVYLVGSIIAGDFYRIPIAVAFVVASVYAVAITGGEPLAKRIDAFSKGAADVRIMLMVWIFVFAGAFAAVAKEMGAVDTTVAITLNFVPENFLPAGIFLATCFISLPIGTLSSSLPDSIAITAVIIFDMLATLLILCIFSS